jgi:DNA-binding CsgD family transcriptional regulator
MSNYQPDRAFCANEFLSKYLTSHERMLVAAFALGYSQADVARAWGISPPAVSKACRRIREKAELYWR